MIARPNDGSLPNCIPQGACVTTHFPDGELDGAVELGAIDERSVRVWVRFAGHSDVTARLETREQAAVTSVIPLSESRDWTAGAAVSLPESAPNAPFTLTVGSIQRNGRFAPMVGEPSALTFGFGSCNMPFALTDDGRIVVREADAAIYPAMRADLERAGARLLVLAGDQIYADEFAPVSVRETPNDDGGDSALMRYRRNYLGYFNQTGFRQLRESFPTLCIWDDHDIYDNWGSTAEKTPQDFRLFAAASDAYATYQHPRNPSGERSGPPFFWSQQWGDIAIIALDLRGARDYDSGTMIGAEQWAWLQSWLSGEAAQQTSTLFVVSSVPVAHTARWFTRTFDFMPKRFAEPIRDRWNSSGFIDSRNELLDALFSWQVAQPERQVIILSGDVHCASAFTLRLRDSPGVVRQVTSSAMTTPLNLKQMVFNRTVVHGHNLFDRQYRYERHFLSLTNNYGGVRLEPLPAGGHRIIIAIRSWNPRKQRLRTTGRLQFQPQD
jgi:phosphodiesterase/alkaline phosphatase D-like protein